MTDERIYEAFRLEPLRAPPSYAELERHIARGRQLRAETTSQMAASASGAVSRLLRRTGARLARWQQQRHTREALMECSDRVLADVGIPREHIPLIAWGVDPATIEQREGWPPIWWRALAARIEAVRRARRDRRRVEGELMAYSDRDLDEIGIRRVDIPTIARGHTPLPANARRAA